MAEAGVETLTQIEWRLNRLEFYLRQRDNEVDNPSPITTLPTMNSVQERLAELEGRFTTICKQSPAIKELVDLINHYPELFRAEEHARPVDDDLSSKLPIVMSFGHDIEGVAAQLHLLRDSPVPDANHLLPLLKLQSRLAQAQAIDEAQTQELSRLRQRSAQTLTDWYTKAVLTGGEQRSEWESRINQAEQTVRRQEIERIKHEQQI